MKSIQKILILSLCLIETGCTTIPTAITEGQNYAKNMEAEKDVVATIEAYGKYRERCYPYINAKKSTLASDIALTVFLAPLAVPLEIRKYIKTGNFFEYHEAREACFYGDALSEQNINFDCLQDWRKGDDYYESDECILYRRNIHKSDVGYFDYKRFLPKNSPINTDSKFLTLIKYYDKIKDCDNLRNVTTDEIAACKNKVKDITIKMATSGVKCMEAYEKEYSEKLDSEGSWYEWAINHDPYEIKRQLLMVGEYDMALYSSPIPVYGKQEALNEVKKTLKDFGKDHLCNIDGWKADIKKMGYHM